MGLIGTFALVKLPFCDGEVYLLNEKLFTWSFKYGLYINYIFLSGHEWFLLNCQKLSFLDFKIHFFVFTQEASIEERIQDYIKTGIWQKT